MPQRLLRIVTTGALVGLVGLLSMAVMILSECRNSSLRCLTTDSELIFPAFAGALIAGMLLYALWGRDGPVGWAFAALGAVLCTGLGAMLGVLVLSFMPGGPSGIDDPSVLLLGPWIVVMMFGEYPATILIWLGSMIAVHLVLRQIFQKHTKA